MPHNTFAAISRRPKAVLLIAALFLVVGGAASMNVRNHLGVGGFWAASEESTRADAAFDRGLPTGPHNLVVVAETRGTGGVDSSAAVTAGRALTEQLRQDAGISSVEAQALGWTFTPPARVTLMLPWNAGELRHYPWYVLPSLSGNLIAVMFVTASTTLFNTTGIEVALHREANLERELNTAGIANILSGALGGYTGCISVSRTILNFNSGGSGRLSGVKGDSGFVRCRAIG